MPLFSQFEFAFRTVAGFADPGRFGESQDAGVTDPGYSNIGRHLNLDEKARGLLRSLGAHRIANKLRVEWNARLKTAAGHADYRLGVISLNPRLIEHPTEIDRTFLHELAHILAQFRAGRRRLLPHGVEWQQACHDLGIGDEKRCHKLPFPVSKRLRRYLYKCPNCQRDFPRVCPIKRAVACLDCCRAHNGGEFDARFRLKLTTQL